MRLRAKIFFVVTVFFSVIFLISGYALISYYYETTMGREVEAGADQYQYNKFVLQSALITRGAEWFEKAAKGQYDFTKIASDMNKTVAFYGEDGSLLFSEFPVDIEVEELLKNVEDGNICYRFGDVHTRRYLWVAGMVSQGDSSLYLVTGMDVEKALARQEEIVQKFGTVYGVAMAGAVLLIFCLSALLTRPIKQLTEAAKEISEGNYGKRIAVGSRDEVGQLAGSFNQMAAAIEEKMQELSDSARQKEDFVANFAHELKTPLTSIIGYADRIYQKELSREDQKQSAWYIWNEGMRLEALSFKLMDLTVLNHKEFLLQEMRADILLEELTKGEAYLLAQKKVQLVCQAEPAYIAVECDLFQSLLFNLIDNAIKAGADRLFLKGYRVSESKYIIALEDNGSGIPQKEIKRITEAFYMVDKSRSRKQHGAGIGLSLAEKIARIHGSSLIFESDGKSGTTVSLFLACRECDVNAAGEQDGQNICEKKLGMYSEY